VPGVRQCVTEGVHGAFRIRQIGGCWRQTARPMCRATRRRSRHGSCPCRMAAAALSPCPAGNRDARRQTEARSDLGAQRPPARLAALDQAKACGPRGQIRGRQQVVDQARAGIEPADVPADPTFRKYARRSARAADNPSAAAPCDLGEDFRLVGRFTQTSFGAVKPGKTMLPVNGAESADRRRAPRPPCGCAHRST
jgi:hypothetical protein